MRAGCYAYTARRALRRAWVLRMRAACVCVM